MSFDEVLDLIVFADELNDPPEPVELSAPALLRRAHAALMDAESFSFEVKGGWPGCRGNHDFGWAQLEAANLIPYAALWRHFLDGNDRYYYIGNPPDWGESEWWLRRGRGWSDVGVERVTDATTFRGGFSSLLQTLADINVYAKPSDYMVVSRNAERVEIEVSIDQPNPSVEPRIGPRNRRRSEPRKLPDLGLRDDVELQSQKPKHLRHLHHRSPVAAIRH